MNSEQTLKDRIPVVDEKLYESDMVRASKYEVVDYIIDDGQIHPIAVIIPGGAYINVCSYVEGKPFAQYLNRRGISAVVVYYRVGEEARHPWPQEDVCRAINYVQDKYKDKVDMKHYSIWGSSAGGHLAASFGTENMGYKKLGCLKPATEVLIYPVITMDEKYTHMDSRTNHIGPDPSAQKIDFASVEKNITPDYPPTYIWCGASDSCVSPENTRLMAAALEKAGVDYECDIFPGVDHGAGLAYDSSAEGWIDKAVAFWMKHC